MVLVAVGGPDRASGRRGGRCRRNRPGTGARASRRRPVNGGGAEEEAAETEALRALSDIRQRFPQWHIGQSGDGWQATPRAIWSVDASTLESLYERLGREEDRRGRASRGEPGGGEAKPPRVLPRI